MKDYPKVGRIIGVVYVGLLTLFALFSGAANGLIANAPNALPWLFAWVAVAVSFAWPRIGGVLFLLLALAATLFFHAYQELILFVIVTLPLVVIGVLLLLKPKSQEPTA